MVKFKVQSMNLARFPMDMLRYDCCYPVSTDDAMNISLSFDPDFKDERPTINLYSPVMKEPTDARWRSFGWLVV